MCPVNDLVKIVLHDTDLLFFRSYIIKFLNYSDNILHSDQSRDADHRSGSLSREDLQLPAFLYIQSKCAVQALLDADIGLKFLL